MLDRVLGWLAVIVILIGLFLIIGRASYRKIKEETSGFGYGIQPENEIRKAALQVYVDYLECHSGLVRIYTEYYRLYGPPTQNLESPGSSRPIGTPLDPEWRRLTTVAFRIGDSSATDFDISEAFEYGHRVDDIVADYAKIDKLWMLKGNCHHIAVKVSVIGQEKRQGFGDRDDSDFVKESWTDLVAFRQDVADGSWKISEWRHDKVNRLSEDDYVNAIDGADWYIVTPTKFDQES